MKTLFVSLLATVLLPALTGIGVARTIRAWSYQELLKKSDLAVIAIPATNKDTEEHAELAGFEVQRGVDTTFEVSAVIKGNPALKNFVLHHYFPGPYPMMLPNSPGFVYFAISDKLLAPPRTYILFLRREADGRYTPVVGQMAPGIAVKELGGVFPSPTIEIQTKLGIDMANVLKECHALKPGMTRAELSKSFSTGAGFSTLTHRTFIYRDCPYIKVEVDFAASALKQNVEKPTDNIIRISKPYLDWNIVD